MFSVILLVYAVLTFVFVYRATGGATNVEFVGGQYVAMYKGRVIKVVTEHEYRWYPSLWTRVMSVWIGAMVSLMLTSAGDRGYEIG